MNSSEKTDGHLANGKLGALRCATVVCRSLQKAVELYKTSLGFQTLEEGSVSPDQAANWGAKKMAGAPYAVLAPSADAKTFLRLIEVPDAVAPKPYSTMGWAALEFSVKNCTSAVDQAEKGGFKVLGPAQDLDFSEGALRAGQVGGANGEVLYLTQINAQLPGYVLPIAKQSIDQMFIVILTVTDTDEATEKYNEAFNCELKDTFTAAVPFIADFCGLEADHEFYVGAVELEPKNYIEIDQVPEKTPQRDHREGYLPTGIAMVTFEVPSLEPFREFARGPVVSEQGSVSAGRKGATITGPYGEWIEVLA